MSEMMKRVAQSHVPLPARACILFDSVDASNGTRWSIRAIGELVVGHQIVKGGCCFTRNERISYRNILLILPEWQRRRYTALWIRTERVVEQNYKHMPSTQ